MKNFKESEFSCKCCGKTEMNADFLNKLDLARSVAGVPFVITSGYRCKKHNKAIGGVDNSSHVRGYAVDISVKDSRSRFRIIWGLCSAGFKRIGVASDFIHVDSDPDKDREVMWVY